MSFASVNFKSADTVAIVIHDLHLQPAIQVVGRSKKLAEAGLST